MDDHEPPARELLLMELPGPIDAAKAAQAADVLMAEGWLPDHRTAEVASAWQGCRILSAWVDPPDDPQARADAKSRLEGLLEPMNFILHRIESRVRRTGDGVMWSGELPPQDPSPAFPVWGYPGVIARLDWQDFGFRIFVREALRDDQVRALSSLFDLWAMAYRTGEGAAYRSRSFEVAEDGESVLFWVDRFRQPGVAEEVVHHLLWIAARASELVPVAAARFENRDVRSRASQRPPPKELGQGGDSPSGLRPSWAPVLLVVLLVMASQLLSSGRLEWALRSAFFLVGAILLTMVSRAWLGRLAFVGLAITAVAQSALLVLVSIPPEHLLVLVGGPDPMTAPARVEAVLSSTSYLSLGTFLFWALVYVRAGRVSPA